MINNIYEGKCIYFREVSIKNYFFDMSTNNLSKTKLFIRLIYVDIRRVSSA